MGDLSREEQIEAVLDDLIGRRAFNVFGNTILGAASPRLDVSRPNIHDSKADFLFEKNAVTAMVTHLQGVLDAIKPLNAGEETQACRDRLCRFVDSQAYLSLDRKKMDIPADLAFQNLVATGFFWNSLYVVLATVEIYERRLRELEDQEKQFWSVSHRAPNYYPRFIALRLARLYAREKGAKPTFGIAADGNYPSTDFGRALERIFQILELKAAVKGAAQWALSQLTEDDLRKPQNALAAYAAGIPPASGAVREIHRMLARSPAKPSED